MSPRGAAVAVQPPHTPSAPPVSVQPRSTPVLPDHLQSPSVAGGRGPKGTDFSSSWSDRSARSTDQHDPDDQHGNRENVPDPVVRSAGHVVPDLVQLQQLVLHRGVIQLDATRSEQDAPGQATACQSCAPTEIGAALKADHDLDFA